MARIYCESIEKGTAKTGSEFLKVLCRTEDRVQHQFYLWDGVAEFSNAVENGNRVFDCMFGGDANFPKISSFEPAVGDVTEFISFIYPNDEHARRVFESLRHAVTDAYLSALCDRVFSAPGPTGFDHVVDAFCVIPAAKAYHHDFRYGLIRHTHEVMTFVNRICDAELLNGPLDKQVALCAALLHDVGKVYEYAFDGCNHAEYGTDVITNQIYLGSHLSRGAEMLEVANYCLLNEQPEFKTDENALKLVAIKHAIVSHHLQREWGAVPKAPQTLEAFLVFLADYYSAAFGKFQAIDWSSVSTDALLGSTSKFDSFFGITPLLNKMRANANIEIGGDD